MAASIAPMMLTTMGLITGLSGYRALSTVWMTPEPKNAVILSAPAASSVFAYHCVSICLLWLTVMVMMCELATLSIVTLSRNRSYVSSMPRLSMAASITGREPRISTQSSMIR